MAEEEHIPSSKKLIYRSVPAVPLLLTVFSFWSVWELSKKGKIYAFRHEYSNMGDFIFLNIATLVVLWLLYYKFPLIIRAGTVEYISKEEPIKLINEFGVRKALFFPERYLTVFLKFSLSSTREWSLGTYPRATALEIVRILEARKLENPMTPEAIGTEFVNNQRIEKKFTLIFKAIPVFLFGPLVLDIIMRSFGAPLGARMGVGAVYLTGLFFAFFGWLLIKGTDSLQKKCMKIFLVVVLGESIVWGIFIGMYFFSLKSV